jgi:CRISPR type III-B/RAMP module RAMP protein Cmr6
VTVHYQSYYQQNAPPTDFDIPVPIPFLGITGAFFFIMDAPNAAWKGYMEKVLRYVLSTHGIGAKRSAGYGCFDFPS